MTFLSTGYPAETAGALRGKTGSPESPLGRLLVVALWIVFAIFIGVLLSFHEPLRLSTGDILLVVILVGGIIGLP